MRGEPPRRVRPLVLLAVVAVFFVGLWAQRGRIAGENDTPFDIFDLPADLSVEFETTPTVGDAGVLVVRGLMEYPDDPLTRVSLIHTVGLIAYRSERWVEVTDGTARIPATTNSMREAGFHRFVVFTDRQRGQLELDLDPGEGAAGFSPIVGPSRTTADGQSKVLLSVFNQDRFGNPIRDGAPVEVIVRRPDGSTETIEGTLDQLVSGIPIRASTDVGIVSVIAVIDGEPSEPVEFLQFAGPPATATLSTTNTEIPADGRSVAVITASEIADSVGKPVTDGTSIRITAKGPNGTTTVDSVVVNGTAQFMLRAPAAPGPVEVSLDTYHTDAVGEPSSIQQPPLSAEAVKPLQVAATPAVESITAVWHGDSGEIEVGPVISAFGGFVNDGTPVRLVSNGSPIASSQIIDGRATLLPPPGSAPSAQNPWQVEVLGVAQEVNR